jgi:gamma-glutamyltranspeptidase/glutathione hydrolase
MGRLPRHALRRAGRCTARRLATLVIAATSAASALAAGHVTPGGAVACAAPDAAAAGGEILRQGGNAVDAAVATALALAVVHPQAGNLGGGGFAVVRFGETVAALDFRETAPAGATRDMYLSADGLPVADRSRYGPLAAGVPGSPAGLFELHRRFGVLPWRRVVAPAAALARDGFVVTDRLHGNVERERPRLERFPATAAMWLPDGAAPPAGSRLKQPRLAETLAAYARSGPPAITTGPRAAAIEKTARSLGGVLSAADLAAYRPVWRTPLRFSAFGWETISMPLPSAGGVILAESLGMLERLDWSAAARGSRLRAHLLVESWRRAYADRFLLGDPTATKAGPAELLAASWIDRRAASIDREKATPSAGTSPWPGTESRETTHVSVIDGAGNAVALTTTLNETFGCGVLVPEVGFFLNNEMDDFSAAPGKPNLYGLVQGEANAVAPGKRMLSSMAPTIIWRAGETVALGSPGGSHIPTAIEQVLLALVVDGASLDEAVSRPRLHHQWLPDRVDYEDGALPADELAGLARLGHTLHRLRQLGEVDAVLRHGDGRLEAVADARGPGATAVVAPLPQR